MKFFFFMKIFLRIPKNSNAVRLLPNEKDPDCPSVYVWTLSLLS